MLIQAVTTTSPNPIYDLSGNDDLNVALGVTLITTGDPSSPFTSDAVLAYSGQHSITVAGTIIAYDDCINLLGAQGAQYLEIASSGVLVSGVGSSIVDADGVLLDGQNTVMVNHGTILAQGSAVQVVVSDGGTTKITNTGLMSAESYGIWNRFGSGTLEFTNTGTVDSLVQSYLGGNFVDKVTNAGTMIGDIELGGGDDLYVGTGGMVDGVIMGGSGNDRFVIGLSNEVIDGGDGIDTLDLSGLFQKMVINLSNPADNRGGGVVGDTYLNIENISGTNYRDAFTGNAADNRLSGGGAHDYLGGGAGNDTLIGGNGADTLSGGEGADVFLYETYADRSDTLLDFTTGVDVMMINAKSYGFGTTPLGALNPDMFVTTVNSNAALDANDRLIFRSSDATLWIDRDGTGGQAPLLLADLADGTIITASDIFLV